jgi:hypothetical protein
MSNQELEAFANFSSLSSLRDSLFVGDRTKNG